MNFFKKQGRLLISSLKLLNKEESLARFGYALAHDLLKHMDSRKLVSQDPLPEEYLPLSELSSDAKAWHLIEKAARYMPIISSFDIKEKEVTAQIKYEKV